MAARRRTIRGMPGEEKDRLVSRIREMAGSGNTMVEAAAQLEEEFPDYQISVDTVKNVGARAGNITFSGQRSRTTVRPATKAEIPELVVKEGRIHELEEELHLMRAKYHASLKQDTLGQRLVEAIVPNIAPLATAAPPLLETKVARKHSPQDVLSLLSCLHNGEVVRPASTMGIGRFDPAIAAARVQYYVDTVIDLAESHHRGENFRKLWLVDVGDNASGGIHDELKATNAFPLGEQLVRTAHLLAWATRDLAHHFAEVELIGVVGNHLRFERKPAFKDKAQNNGDWVIYHTVKALLADQKNVTVTIPEAPWATPNIQGHEFFFTHGDMIKMYFQFPWYDTARFVTQMAQLLVGRGHPYPRYWGFGQFHQVNMSQLSYGEWLFTGSAKGPDEYSIGKLRAGTPPAWLFAGVHPRRGVSFRYPVDMEFADPEEQTRYQAAAQEEFDQ